MRPNSHRRSSKSLGSWGCSDRSIFSGTPSPSGSAITLWACRRIGRIGIHPKLDSWSKVFSINVSLTELGQLVSEVLKADYVDWETEYEPPEDLPDFGE